MWIEKTNNGKYKAVERYKDFSGATKKVSITIEKNTASTRKQAQSALARKIELAIKKQEIAMFGEPKKVTLEYLVEEYRADQKVTVKKSTYKGNYYTCNTLLKIFGKDLLVEEITASLIRKRLLQTNEEYATLNNYLSALKKVLRWGYKNDLVKDISYLDKVEKFKDISQKKRIEDKFLESEEVVLLLNGMKSEKWRELTEFLVLSGLRFGEVAALTTDDIDLKERFIRVSKTYSSTVYEVTTPKTASSVRDVYIQDELLPLCKTLKAKALMQSLASGSRLLFQKNGTHIRYPAYSWYLAKYSQSILARCITPHTLRHTHASLLMEQGVDIDTISRRLGHENSKVTREIYLHTTKKLQEKDNQKVLGVKIL